MADTPVRAGYAQATAGYSWLSGPLVRGEVGVHPTPGTSAYFFGQWDRVEPMVGVGLRYQWSW